MREPRIYRVQFRGGAVRDIVSDIVRTGDIKPEFFYKGDLALVVMMDCVSSIYSQYPSVLSTQVEQAGT